MGGNFRVGVPQRRFVAQDFAVEYTTGTGAGSAASPLNLGMEAGNYGSLQTRLVVPWQASLVGVTASCRFGYRVTAGTMKIELGYLEHPTAAFPGWGVWGPQNCVVTPDTMPGVTNIQWAGWQFENNQHVVPEMAALLVRLSMEDCVWGDGTAGRWLVQVMLEAN